MKREFTVHEDGTVEGASPTDVFHVMLEMKEASDREAARRNRDRERERTAAARVASAAKARREDMALRRTIERLIRLRGLSDHAIVRHLAVQDPPVRVSRKRVARVRATIVGGGS